MNVPPRRLNGSCHLILVKQTAKLSFGLLGFVCLCVKLLSVHVSLMGEVQVGLRVPIPSPWAWYNPTFRVLPQFVVLILGQPIHLSVKANNIFLNVCTFKIGSYCGCTTVIDLCSCVMGVP